MRLVQDLVVPNQLPATARKPGRDYPPSYAELRAWFPDDAACLDYLEWLRWPDGFVCPRCGALRRGRNALGPTMATPQDIVVTASRWIPHIDKANLWKPVRRCLTDRLRALRYRSHRPPPAFPAPGGANGTGSLLNAIPPNWRSVTRWVESERK